MNVIESLNELGRKAEELCPQLNRGGCCVFAALVSEALRERFGIIPRGVVAGSFSVHNLDEARSNVPDRERTNMHAWNDAGVSFGHVGIEFDYNGTKWIYESAGCKKAPQTYLRTNWWEICEGRLEFDEVIGLSNSPGWNRAFNRDQIPELRKLVHTTLQKAEKEA